MFSMHEKLSDLEKLDYWTEALFAMHNCANIVSRTNIFKAWMKEEYEDVNFDTVFHGYKFFIETVIRCFLNKIVQNTHLGIEEDFVFYRACFAGIPLHKIPNTCEKTNHKQTI